eukprot:7835737-Lingulodinium_polyedra.AAC.1
MPCTSSIIVPRIPLSQKHFTPVITSKCQQVMNTRIPVAISARRRAEPPRPTGRRCQRSCPGRTSS